MRVAFPKKKMNLVPQGFKANPGLEFANAFSVRSGTVLMQPWQHQVDNSAFNATAFVAPPQAVAMEFDLFGGEAEWSFG